jgi:hypothetical protein
MDSLSYMDNYKPAGSASNPQLDTLVQQILARMRARMATQQQPVIPVQQPQPMPMPQPMTAVQPAPQAAPAPQQAAPVAQQAVAPVAQAAPNPVVAAMSTMPLFPGAGAPVTGDWEIYKQFVSGSVPEFARDYYAQQIAQGRTNDTEQSGFYNASGEIGNMNNGAWG